MSTRDEFAPEARMFDNAQTPPPAEPGEGVAARRLMHHQITHAPDSRTHAASAEQLQGNFSLVW
ncbi:hypothetical protein ACFWVF_19825 [Streptomyces sp. NPDC058659]|uniref:hypothetical protein n=1 Tax=Streptomyces sp. NPDC058659 TaxID=3346581 RepID=UPI003657D078